MIITVREKKEHEDFALNSQKWTMGHQERVEGRITGWLISTITFNRWTLAESHLPPPWRRVKISPETSDGTTPPPRLFSPLYCFNPPPFVIFSCHHFTRSLSWHWCVKDKAYVAAREVFHKPSETWQCVPVCEREGMLVRGIIWSFATKIKVVFLRLCTS